jgi:hypothetical protein
LQLHGMFKLFAIIKYHGHLLCPANLTNTCGTYSDNFTNG